MISSLFKAKFFTYCAATLLILFISPVQADTLIEPVNFNIVNFSIAFVLGIYFLLLSARVAITPFKNKDALLLSAVTFSLLGIFNSLRADEQSHIVQLFSFLTLFLSFCYQWCLLKIVCQFPKYSDEITAVSENTFLNENKRVMIVLAIINLITAIYILFLWLIPEVNSSEVFVIVNVLILLLTAVYIFTHPNTLQQRITSQLLIFGSSTLVYMVVIYLSGDELASVNGLIYLAFLVYLPTIVIGHSELIRVLINSNNDQELEKVSKEDIFTYTHDVVTNLPTAQQALSCIEKIQHNEGKRKFAIVVFKPINFQKMNAVLGCHNSDILLLQLAYCLQKKVEHNTSLLDFDTKNKGIRIARLQGLHFLLVLDLSTDEHESKMLVNQLCQQLALATPDALSFKSFNLNFELAFGIAITHGYGGSMSEVISHANDALMSAENQKKSQVYYDHNATRYTNRQLLSMDRLKQDINTGNLHWYLQPQVNMCGEDIKGFELMVHWYNDDEALSLNNFIEIAELSGDIHILTKHMIRQACEMIHQLSRLGMAVPVSIKISNGELVAYDIADYIEQALASHKLDPSLIIVELSENVFTFDAKKIHSMIDQLNELGVGIALDNFSGNYESLRFLRKLVIKQVKINCNLLTHDNECKTETAIVDSLMNFSHSMGLSLIGTGLDTEAAKQVFIGMAGNVAQGKVIKEGIVAEELEIWLKTWFDKYPHSRPRDCKV